jgi:LuxR family maltose regulon positive regulatory protein
LVFHRGEIKTLLAWYKTLPAAYMDDNPFLCLQFGLAFALNGHWVEAERLLGQVEAANLAGADSAEMENLVVLSFMIASHRQDVAALQAIIEKAAQEPKPTPSTKTILGLIHFLLGDYETTSRLLGEAQVAAEEQEDWATAFNALLQHCRMRVYMGHLRESHRLSLLALERSDLVEKGLISQVSLAYSVLGRIYIEWDEPEKAFEYLKKAVEASERSGFRTGMLSSNMIMQAEVYDAQGELAAVQEAAEQALIFAARHDPPAEVEWLKTYQARLWLNEGNLVAAVDWLEKLEQMQRERPLPVSMFYPSQIRPVTKARILLSQRKTAEAIGILTTLTAERPMLLTVEAFALLALARQANGDSVNALLALEQTLAMAEPEKRIRLLLNLGRPMFHLLESFYNQRPKDDPLRPFVRLVLERFPDEPGSAAQVEPLTDRELDILGLIVAGHSNQEIADSLVLALSTVKWYINALYGKLQVKSRSQAISKAHELGIASSR